MSIDLPPAIEVRASEDGAYVFRDEAILGTRMHVILVAQSFAVAQAAALLARAEIDRLDLILNSRNPDSELSVLNRSREHRASPELFAVVAAAEEWRARTDGAYSGRLGRIIRLWESANGEPPTRGELARLALKASRAHVGLNVATRAIVRPDAVEFALDAIAKGWIVDRAYEIACGVAGVFGALIDIGGDVRCGGLAPGPEGWRIDVSDPRLPADNAPSLLPPTSGTPQSQPAVEGHGIAYSAAFDTARPSRRWMAGLSAMRCLRRSSLPLPRRQMPSRRQPSSCLGSNALELADARKASARITANDGTVAWTRLAQADAAQAHFTAAPEREPTAQVAASGRWQDGWQALATFTAPRRQLIRDPDFRSPYMAMWITGPDNQLVRTLILVGKRPDWQKDNFIWWSMNRASSERLVSTRSMSTSGQASTTFSGMASTIAASRSAQASTCFMWKRAANEASTRIVR